MRFLVSREKERDPDFVLWGKGREGKVRYQADRTIKGDQCLTFAGRYHATVAGGTTAFACARIQRRRSGATRLTEPCYSCTFYARRHSTGQWHPVLIPRDWLYRCRSQVRRGVLHARGADIANLINSPNEGARKAFGFFSHPNKNSRAFRASLRQISKCKFSHFIVQFFRQ